MNELKKFEEFVNENINEAKKIKKFKDVKKGDVGEDYNGDKVIILDKAFGKDYKKLKEYDISGAMEEIFYNPEELGYSKKDLPKLELVAVEVAFNNTTEEAVYIYGDDGVIVYQ